MTKGMFKKLTEGKDSAFMSYELATIVRDVDLGVDDEYFAIRPMNEGKLYDILAKLELFSIIKRLGISPDAEKTEKSLSKKRKGIAKGRLAEQVMRSLFHSLHKV